jgi:hypothetical protein
MPFSSWESFYVIIGSSGAALTGLNFVVIALTAESRVVKPTPALIRAYETPTIVHFCAVLLLSALMSAPWQSMGPIRVGFAASGIAGMVYVLALMLMIARPKEYQPEAEDWIWRGIFPFLAYTALVIAAMVLGRHPATALFMVAGASLLLLYVGIHNAWDTVTYIVFKRQGENNP